MRYIILIVVLIFGVVIVDFTSALFTLFLFLVGSLFVKQVFKSKTKYHIKLFQITFIVGLTFIYMSYGYMKYHNYGYLFGNDSVDAFIPKTLEYINNSTGFFSAIINIFKNYSFFDRDIPGYYSGAVLFGYISQYLHFDIYYSLQLYNLLFGAFVANIVFLISNKYITDTTKSYKYSLIIFICSPILFYTANISRDLQVTLLYLTAINLTLTSKFSSKNLIYLVIVILITMTFRVESGLFLFVLIPTYLLLTLQNKKQRNYVIAVSVIIVIISTIFFTANYNQIQSVYTANQEAYFDESKFSEESGMISKLQSVPIGGDFASVIYNGVQPIPFWSRFTASSKDPRVEIYNIMNFPKSVSSFFNWFVIVYILFWLFSKHLRIKTKSIITKPLKYNLWIGLIFLLMQSAVIAQRRLLGYYIIFYILFFIIYSQIGNKEKKTMTFIAVSGFVALQVVSFFI